MSIKLNGELIVPTIFPDGTSQIWKISGLDKKNFNIEWNFEHEGELFHLQQLVHLIRTGRVPCPINLYMPFLPYSRQDKHVSNETTFALQTFAKAINGMKFDEVSTIDAHSNVAEILFEDFKDIKPTESILFACRKLENDSNTQNPIFAFPDSGSYHRYSALLWYVNNPIIGDKSRNQLTGYIEQYNIKGDPKNEDILIIDDICDGGMTFRLMAKELYKQGAKSVHLYITHGIFSKGLPILRAAGIKRIFTKDGEIDEIFDNPKPSNDLLETELSNM